MLLCIVIIMLCLKVGARDGLQNEKKVIPLDVKVELIKKYVYLRLFMCSCDNDLIDLDRGTLFTSN